MKETAVTEPHVHLLKLYYFLVYGTIAVHSTYFALYLKDMGVSNLQIGLLMAGGPIISILFSPVWAYLSDRLNNIKAILLLVLIGNFIVMQFVFTLGSFVTIFAVMLLFSVFQAPLFSQSSSLVLNVIEGSGYGFGSVRAWASLGWAIIGLAAGPVIGWLGIGQMWIVYDVLLLITIASACLLPRGNAKADSNKEVFSNSEYIRVFTNAPFLWIIVLGILVSITNSINLTFAGIYVDDLGGSSALVGWAVFTSSILEFPVYLLFDRYLQQRSRTLVFWLIAVSLLYALRWHLMSTVTSAASIIFIQFLHSITFGGYLYIGTLLTSRLVPRRYRSTGQALFGLSYSGISAMIAGVAGGWMYESFGPQLMYQTGTGMSLLSAVGFVVIWFRVKGRKEFI